jgi:hypothetical protein
MGNARFAVCATTFSLMQSAVVIASAKRPSVGAATETALRTSPRQPGEAVPDIGCSGLPNALTLRLMQYHWQLAIEHYTVLSGTQNPLRNFRIRRNRHRQAGIAVYFCIKLMRRNSPALSMLFYSGEASKLCDG